jgi:hypothetical protein
MQRAASKEGGFDSGVEKRSCVVEFESNVKTTVLRWLEEWKHYLQ